MTRQQCKPCSAWISASQSVLNFNDYNDNCVVRILHCAKVESQQLPLPVSFLASWSILQHRCLGGQMADLPFHVKLWYDSASEIQNQANKEPMTSELYESQLLVKSSHPSIYYIEFMSLLWQYLLLPDRLSTVNLDSLRLELLPLCTRFW